MTNCSEAGWGTAADHGHAIISSPELCAGERSCPPGNAVRGPYLCLPETLFRSEELAGAAGAMAGRPAHILTQAILV